MFGRATIRLVIGPHSSWDIDLGGPKEPCFRGGSRSPHVKGQF